MILTKSYHKVNDMHPPREEAMLLPGRFPLNCEVFIADMKLFVVNFKIFYDLRAIPQVVT